MEEGEGAVYSLAQGTLQEHLRLDSAAAAAVTLLPDPTAPHEFGSLYNVLNRCVSAFLFFENGSPVVADCCLFREMLGAVTLREGVFLGWFEDF